VELVRRALAESTGDMLVFLPGAGEIRRVRGMLADLEGPGLELLMLYGDMAAEEQDAVLRGHRPDRRRIVLATNVAETSVTIPGVTVVVDSGLARRSLFDPGTGMSRLELRHISRASCTQRAGRAGRTRPGRCYRTWSESAHLALPAHTPPEVVETDLAPLMLELAGWGAQDASALRWLDVPPAPMQQQARELLAQAYAGFRAAGHASGEYLAWAGVVDTFIYAWSEFASADPWIDEFDALRERHPQFPSREAELRATAAIFALLMYRRPQHPQLPQWTQRLDALVAQDDVEPSLRMTAAVQLVLYYEWWVGNLARANELVRRIEPFASARAVGPFVRLAWESILAISHWMNADNDAAFAAVRRGLALADETGAHVWDFMLVAQGAVAAATSGDAEQARGFLERLGERAPGYRPLDSVQYHFFSFQQAMRRDDRAAMLAHGQAGVASAVQAGVYWAEVYTRPALAQALHLAGDAAGARRELDLAAEVASAVGCSNAIYYLHELELQFAEARGDRAAQLESIARMFQVMREQGFTNSAWWRDEPMARWCRIALEHAIETDFVRMLVRRRGLRPDGAAARLEHWPWPVRVRTLGEFSVELDGEPLRFTGKVQKRPLALLKALVAFGGSGVPESLLADALWPDADGDDAHNAFVTTLQRLRKLLVQRDALLLQEGRLGLNPQRCWVDALAFESVDPDDADPCAADDRERALRLYRGAFLAQEDAAWAIARRERLRARFVRLGDADVRGHLERSDWEGAVACLEGLLQADATVEPFYQQLMRVQHRLGRSAEVLATYRRCRDVLGATLQLPPSASTEGLLKELGASSRAG